MEVCKKEDKLLILLSKTSLTIANNKQIYEIMSGGIDYSYFLYSCYINRIDMIVYHNVVKYGHAHFVLPKVLKVLRKTFYYNNSRLLAMENEFWKIVNEFNEHKIKYAVIKGFALNKLLFRDEDGIYTRDFNDLDFLVLRDEISHIKKILNSLGYMQGEYDVENDDIKILDRKSILEFSIRSHQTAPFLKKIDIVGFPQIVIEIDINFTIFNGGSMDDNISMNEIMENRKRFYENNLCQFWYLNTSEMLIQLVFHLYRETKYEIKKSEKDAITLQKFNDVREFFIHCIMESEYEKAILLIKKAHIESEVLWVMKYILVMYADEKIKDFISLLQL